MKRPFNFGAGPAQLPEQVLRRLSKEAINWKGSGMAVAELPHRGKLFQEIIDETKLLIRSLLGLPDSFEVMFMQGGARGQNAIIPMNLLFRPDHSDEWAEESKFYEWAEESKFSRHNTQTSTLPPPIHARQQEV